MTLRPGRRMRIAALALVCGVLAGCAGKVPTPAEMAVQDHDSQVAQILRVAESTRAGGDLASAVGMYRRAHQLAPEKVAPLKGLGETLAALGDMAEAADAYALAAELDPKNVDVLYGLGKTLSALGRPADAAERFQAAIDANPDDARAYNGLGVALDAQGKHQEAQQVYIDGLEIDPDNLGLKNNLGFSLLLSGNFTEAISDFEAVARHPLATARHRQNLALAYGLAGQTEKAAAIARRDLNEAEVANNLAIYARLRGLSGAERDAAILGFWLGISTQNHQ